MDNFHVITVFIGIINSEMTAREDIFCILYTCLFYEISMSDAVNLSPQS